MKIYRFVDTDTYFNLALEEVLFQDLSETNEDCFITYVNQASVIVGKNQNIYEECDLSYLEKTGIKPARRITGGGTVYHDLGNLNFSFLMRDRSYAHDFERLLKPVITYLEKLGLKSEIADNSNLLSSDLKISGNAQAVKKQGVMQHGTLLFDSNLEKLKKSLDTSKNQIESKAVKSLPKPVQPIKEQLRSIGRVMSMPEFRRGLEKEIARGEAKIIKASKEQEARARKAVKEKYSQFAWIFGKSPRFSTRASIKAYDSSCLASVLLEVKHGQCEKLRTTGCEEPFVRELAAKLEGAEFSKAGFIAALKELPEAYATGLWQSFLKIEQP